MAEMQGFREALEALREFPDHIAPQGGGPINQALFGASEKLREQMESNAQGLGPGNHQRKGFSIVGRLKDNIIRQRDPQPEQDGHYARVFVAPRARIYWAPFVELGTERKGKTFQAPQPFMRPVVNQAGDAALSDFRKRLQRSVARITRKLNRGPK